MSCNSFSFCILNINSLINASSMSFPFATLKLMFITSCESFVVVVDVVPLAVGIGIILGVGGTISVL